jgi:hypothetical protein
VPSTTLNESTGKPYFLTGLQLLAEESIIIRMKEKCIVFLVVKFILPAFQGYEEKEKTGKRQF